MAALDFHPFGFCGIPCFQPTDCDACLLFGSRLARLTQTMFLSNCRPTKPQQQQQAWSSANRPFFVQFGSTRKGYESPWQPEKKASAAGWKPCLAPAQAPRKQPVQKAPLRNCGWQKWLPDNTSRAPAWMKARCTNWPKASRRKASCSPFWCASSPKGRMRASTKSSQANGVSVPPIWPD